MRYAVIDSSNIVQNIIIWDGGDGWSPQPGYSTVALSDGQACDIGWTYDPVAKTFTAAP